MPFIASADGGGVDVLAVSGGPAGSNGWSIMEDSGIVEANPETGPMATVKFKVYDANQRYSFVNQLLGQWMGSPPSNFSFVGPYRYQPSPNMLCTSVVSIESLDRKVPMLGFNVPWWFGKEAVVTAIFTRPPWIPLSTGGFFTVEFNGSGEYLNLPQTLFQFGDGTPINFPWGLLVAQAQIVVKKIRMPFLPDVLVVPLYSTLNNAPFQIGWNTYATGTLMFVGMNSCTNAAPFGGITYDVSYLFQWRQWDWNYAPYPSPPYAWQLVTDGSGNNPYKYANFNLIP